MISPLAPRGPEFPRDRPTRRRQRLVRARLATLGAFAVLAALAGAAPNCGSAATAPISAATRRSSDPAQPRSDRAEANSDAAQRRSDAALVASPANSAVPAATPLSQVTPGVASLATTITNDATTARDAAPSSPVVPVPYRVALDVVSDGYERGQWCWFHPRAGAIPGATPTVVLTMQKFNVNRSDVFYPIASLVTRDLGRTWSPIVVHDETLGRRSLDAGFEEAICDFTPKWHAQTGRLLATGHTVVYHDDRLVTTRPRFAVWSVYDPAANTWARWQKLELPHEPRFANAGAGSTQRVDLENGDILLPVYAKEITAKAYYSTVLRCRFDGETLRYVEHGSELTVPIDRGLYEPSLARFGDGFYLTLRNDRAAYVAFSRDGLHFDAPRPWTFDDGTDLGSYNTQAHWVTHADGLFLAYTRRGADNDQVIRHRAPLFLAQVDPERRVVIRATERAIVPNKGAQLGNFAVVDVSANETWVTTSEGMAPGDPSKYGANGRVYAARLLWEKPNAAWNRH